MRRFVLLVVLLTSVQVARAEEVPKSGLWDTITKSWPPSVSVPSLPDFGMPDLSRMGDAMMGEFKAFIQQVSDTLPILEEMGYEVSTFRVQWGLPPRAKLRLRSRDTTDPTKIEAIAAKASGSMLMRALITGAAEAKRVQSSMKLGTAIIDVDFAVKPKVRMSFLSRKLANNAAERDVEDLDLACGQALAD